MKYGLDPKYVVEICSRGSASRTCETVLKMYLRWLDKEADDSVRRNYELIADCLPGNTEGIERATLLVDEKSGAKMTNGDGHPQFRVFVGRNGEIVDVDVFPLIFSQGSPDLNNEVKTEVVNSRDLGSFRASVTHIPTGVRAHCSERTAHRAQYLALAMLRAKITTRACVFPARESVNVSGITDLADLNLDKIIIPTVC